MTMRTLEQGGNISQVVYSSNFIVAGSWDNTVRIFDPTTFECKKTMKHESGVSSVAVSPDESWIVSGSYDSTLKVWDPSSGQCLRTLTGHTGAARRRRPVEPRGRLLVDAATGAGLVRRRPVEGPCRLRVERQHAQGVGRCRGEDGTSGCPAPDSEEFRRASHRRVPLGPLVCFVSAFPRRVGTGCNLLV